MKNRKMQTITEFIAEESARDPEFAAEMERRAALHKPPRQRTKVPVFDKAALAGQVKELRKGAKLTQVQLAQKAGTRQEAIARLESGRVTPRLDVLAKVARAMGRSVEVRFVEQTGAPKGRPI